MNRASLIKAYRTLRHDGVLAFLDKCRRRIDVEGKLRSARALLRNDFDNSGTNRKELQEKALTLRSRPIVLTIESTSRCNLNCLMCPEHRLGEYEGSDLPPRFMSWIAPLLIYGHSYQLHANGEPLMSPVLWDILETMAGTCRTSPQVSINSNGLLLTKSTVRRLVNSPLTLINLSCDATREETYAFLRGASMARLHRNIRALCDAKPPSLTVALNMTVMRENLDQLPELPEMARSLGADAIDFWPINEFPRSMTDGWHQERCGRMFSYANQMLSTLPPERIREVLGRTLDNASARKIRFLGVGDLPGLYHRFGVGEGRSGTEDGAGHVEGKTSPKSMCTAPWEWMHVTGDASIRPCCHMKDPIATIHDGSALDIWNSPTWQDLRRGMALHGLHPLCSEASCSFVRGRCIEVPSP